MRAALTLCRSWMTSLELHLRGPRDRSIGAIAGLLRAWWLAPVGVIAPLIILGITLLAPQMPDMFAGMADGGSGSGTWRLGSGLGCASGVLGLASWYWTRAVLNAEVSRGDRTAPHGPAWAGAAGLSPFWRAFCAGYRQAPRWAALPAALLAVSPPLLAWINESASQHHLYWGATCVSAAIFALSVVPFVVFRRATIYAAMVPLAVWLVLALVAWNPARPMTEWRVALVVVVSVPAWLAHRRDWSPKHLPAWAWWCKAFGLFAGAPLGWLAGLAVLLAAPVIAVMIEFWPWIVAATFDAPPAAMVAMALVIGPFAMALTALRAVAPPYGTWAAVPGGRTVKLLTGAVALVWLVFAPPDVLDDYLAPGLYRVRHFKDALPARPSLEDALDRWQKAQRKDCAIPADAPLPVIIAAAEGGASRAAVWFLSSARLLDQATDGRFGRYLFAISGVSGGSLGAVTYLQALADDQTAGRSPCAGPFRRDRSDDLRRMAVESDPLAPALAGYFLNDALMRLLPLQWAWAGYRDRGVLLELAFEQNWQTWRHVPDGDVPVSAGVLALRQSLSEPSPHLFLNGTDTKSGFRLITSTVDFHADANLFPLADDLLFRLRHDVPASTAVTNSARFPLISPAGRAVDRQVIDGGYFDNYGSRTADDLVLAIKEISGKHGWNLMPIVVVVSNDAEIAREALETYTPSCRQEHPAVPDAVKQGKAKSPTIELAAPVLGLIATRDAHAADALQILRRRLCEPGARTGPLFHIALPEPGAHEAAPMNWVLNQMASTFLLDIAPAVPFNQTQAGRLRGMLDAIGAPLAAKP